jgi:hypothetical protein
LETPFFVIRFLHKALLTLAFSFPGG